MTTYGRIGGRIATLRQARGYTQEQLGALLNVTAQAVSKWETGKALPDIILLAPLARFHRQAGGRRGGCKAVWPL